MIIAKLYSLSPVSFSYEALSGLNRTHNLRYSRLIVKRLNIGDFYELRVAVSVEGYK